MRIKLVIFKSFMLKSKPIIVTQRANAKSMEIILKSNRILQHKLPMQIMKERIFVKIYQQKGDLCKSMNGKMEKRDKSGKRKK